MLYVPCLLVFLFRLEALAISWSAMFHVILSWLGPRQGCNIVFPQAWSSGAG